MNELQRLTGKLNRRLATAMMDWIFKRVDMDKYRPPEPYQTNPDEDYPYAHQSYKIHPWVYAAVRICSQSAAKVPIEVYREQVKGDMVERIPVPGHPVSQLLSNPNARMSRYGLIENTVAFRKLDGNSYWMLVRRGDTGPAEMIVPLRPDFVRVAKDDNGQIVGYIYTSGGEELPIPTEDMIHHKQFSATSDTFGLGDLQAARNTLLDDMEVRQFNFNFFRNSAVPRGGLATEQPVNDTEYRRISARWAHAHKGTAYAHKVAIMEKGLKWVDIGMKPTDMDHITRTKMNREEVGAVFGTPPNKLNDWGGGKWNTDAQERQFMHDTIEPQMMEICDTINLNMWKIMGAVEAAIDPIKTQPNWRKVPALKRERLEMEKADNDSVKFGLRTINEIREQRNEKPVPWGDTYWKQGALVDAVTGAPSVQTLSVPSTDSGNQPDARDASVPLRITSTDLWQQKAAEIWNGHWIKQEHLERAVRGFHVRLVRLQERIMLGRLAEFDRRYLDANNVRRAPRTEWEVESILFDLEKAIDETGDKYGKISQMMIKEGGERGIELAQVAGQFDMKDPNVVKFVNKHRNRYAKKVNTTTWKNMRAALAEMAKDGASTSQMVDRIETYMKRRRADKYRIARTETNSALNGGLQRGYKQSNVVETKTWVNAGDSFVRDSHWLTEAEVGIDQPFMLDNGVHLDFPGDPDGPVEEIAECRCTTAPGIRKKD